MSARRMQPAPRRPGLHRARGSSGGRPRLPGGLAGLRINPVEAARLLLLVRRQHARVLRDRRAPRGSSAGKGATCGASRGPGAGATCRQPHSAGRFRTSQVTSLVIMLWKYVSTESLGVHAGAACSSASHATSRAEASTAHSRARDRRVTAILELLRGTGPQGGTRQGRELPSFSKLENEFFLSSVFYHQSPMNA